MTQRTRPARQAPEDHRAVPASGRIPGDAWNRFHAAFRTAPAGRP